jgi:hypothetical protein
MSQFTNQRFKVRRDRADFRDYYYVPPANAPPRRFPESAALHEVVTHYLADHLVLQQGQYGACCGFGLAAVINLQRWRQALLAHRRGLTGAPGLPAPWRPPDKVSPAMLYVNARRYDNRKGERYEGSTCRGAVKGLHHEGVCHARSWPYRGRPMKPKGLAWKEEAKEIRLGAYYRIGTKQIDHLKAAIHELHALFVSADVHDGWMYIRERTTLDETRIRPIRDRSDVGGHAFALVGYTLDGFVVQNSWGRGWGYGGFAVLPFEDWHRHAYDAWAISLDRPLGHDPKTPD